MQPSEPNRKFSARLHFSTTDRWRKREIQNKRDKRKQVTQLWTFCCFYLNNGWRPWTRNIGSGLSPESYLEHLTLSGFHNQPLDEVQSLNFLELTISHELSSKAMRTDSPSCCRKFFLANSQLHLIKVSFSYRFMKYYCLLWACAPASQIFLGCDNIKSSKYHSYYPQKKLSPGKNRSIPFL